MKHTIDLVQDDHLTQIMPMAIFLIISSIVYVDTCIVLMTANKWANTMELWNCSWSRRVIYWIQMRTSIPRLKQGPHSSQRCHIPEIQQHASLEQCFLWRSTLLGLPTTFKFLLSLSSKSSQNAIRHHLMLKQFWYIPLQYLMSFQC